MSSRRVTGVAHSCSMVCSSFSRTSPVDSARATSMRTMPIVPGRKKSESRSSGLKRMTSLILIGGLRGGPDGWSGSSRVSSAVASSLVSTLAP